MTYDSIFDEVDLKEVKKLKKENNQLKKTIDILQTDNDIKDYEIRILKERLKEKK